MTAPQPVQPARAPTDAPARSRAAMVQQIVTPAGFTIWLVEDYAVPLVAMDFAFRAGCVNDPPGRAGAATMMAGLLDEGAGDLDAEAFHRALDDKAVEISFHAGYDATMGSLKTLSRHIDPAFDLLQLTLNKPRFDEDAIERIRAQSIAGLRHAQNDPDAVVERAWRGACFGDHPYGRPSRGDLDSVPKITRDDIVAMHRMLLTRDTLKIAVVGAIDAGRIAALVDKTFGDLPATGGAIEPADITARCDTRTVVDVDVPQSAIRFSLPGIDRHDPDFFAAIVLNHVFGGGSFSSRLFKQVREERGLAYSVWSHLQPYRHAPLLIGGTSTKNERAAESLSVIEDEIAKLLADGVSEDELDKAKKFLIGSYALRFDTSTKIAANLVALQVDDYPVEILDRRNEIIAAVTREDLARVAQRLFAGRKLLVSVAGRPAGL